MRAHRDETVRYERKADLVYAYLFELEPRYITYIIDMLSKLANQEKIHGQEHTGYTLEIQALD